MTRLDVTLFSASFERPLGWPITIPPSSLLAAVASAVAVGVVFGYYPAGRALHLDQMEALRHEWCAATMRTPLHPTAKGIRSPPGILTVSLRGLSSAQVSKEIPIHEFKAGDNPSDACSVLHFA